MDFTNREIYFQAHFQRYVFKTWEMCMVKTEEFGSDVINCIEFPL